MLKEEIKLIDLSEIAVKKTGITIGIILILIGFILWWFGKASYIYFLAIGGFLIILSFIAVNFLVPFHKLWIIFALLLGFIMSHIILALLFYLIVTPIGILAKLVGKKFIPLGFDKNANSYWEKRDDIKKQKIDLERQF